MLKHWSNYHRKVEAFKKQFGKAEETFFFLKIIEFFFHLLIEGKKKPIFVTETYIKHLYNVSKWKLFLKFNTYTSSLVPLGNVCQVGFNSTIWSLTQRSHSISLLHIAFFSGGRGSNLQSCRNIVAKDSQNIKYIADPNFSFKHIGIKVHYIRSS